ncbi:MAG: glutamine synthetase family protein [Planctomycetota bacterium]|jgi:glutamine synthetase
MSQPADVNAATIEAIRQSPHKRVKVAITDLDGILRGKFIHKDKFLSAAKNGFGFCNVVFGWDMADDCYENGVRYTGWHSGYPDAQARIDLATKREVPWDDGVPFFLADFVDEAGEPLAVCPRQVLKQVIKKAEGLGYSPRFGLEFEWFNFKETPDSLAAKGGRNPTPLTPGMFGYSVLRASLNQPYFTAIMEQLDAFGVPIEGLHTETGPGVYEAALGVSGALEAADRGVLFKTGVKEIAYGFGILPSFMAKWSQALPGCSGHMHQSLWDKAGETNLFHDEERPRRMSPLFESYLAGQLALLPDLLALYAPTVNSYKRLVEGAWAPTRVTWGDDNRTSALRVIAGGPSATRLETRVSGSDMNPYLAVAAALGSGLFGIENGLMLQDAPIAGNAYAASDRERLPKTLHEAAQRLSDSAAARGIFGDAFVDHYVKTREWEWTRFGQAVTDWELRRYFEIV